MTSISVYLLKVNLLLSVLYLFYFLFLRKETFVKANRIYFLSGIVVSLVLPFFTYSKVIMVKAVPFLDVTRFTSVEAGVLPVQNFWNLLNAEQIALVLYAVVVFVLMLRLVKRIYNLVQYLKSLPQSPFDKNTLIDSDTKEAYSFWKWIILPQNKQVVANSDIIIAHEAIHVKQRHTIDVLIINVLKNIFWFNPVLILMQKAINLNLEYIVDQEISKKFDVYQYQMTLIQFEKVKTQPFALVNSFAFPSLKKRVLMLNTQKSPIMKKLKFVLTAPILAAFFLSFQIKVKAEVLSAIQTEYENVITKELVVQNDTLADGEETLTRQKAELKAQRKELALMQKELEIQQQKLEKLREELKVQKEELAEKQSKTAVLSRVETENRKAEITAHKKEMESRRAEAEQQRTEVKARLAELKAQREKELANRKAEITARKKEMESRRAEAEQ
ncbi:M56 family metallopeptidase [Myroides indicus]|uniref:Beta-lactamase regulating signal transducer with metallopeptidase domain n=1 Tax=Myroides indicus TaxID=1323422 RepID=A0A4R7ESM9_9FLAO|nr:M56 family metallopeptidase [Myroides indicus]TDS56611.1 beta-lactamase regulating signal transducer with metallopeptidase domain [Myroides indicus]